jgi:hypothetical protein
MISDFEKEMLRDTLVAPYGERLVAKCERAGVELQTHAEELQSAAVELDKLKRQISAYEALAIKRNKQNAHLTSENRRLSDRLLSKLNHRKRHEEKNTKAKV